MGIVHHEHTQNHNSFFDSFDGMKILHIEDSKPIVDSFSKVLKKQGHDYFSTFHGKKGLELILNNDYDLILLDLTMPNFSGFDILTELDQKGVKEKNNIVVVTASHLPDNDTKPLFKNRVRGTLYKPVSLQALLNEVKQMEITVTT